MAMTNCKECGSPVSSSAPICPHCGIRRKTHPVTSLIALGIVLFAGYMWLDYEISGMPPELSPCDSEQAERKVRELTSNSEHNNVDIVIFSEPKTLRKSTERLECEAKVMLSDASEMIVMYTLFIEDGESYIKTSWRDAD